MAKKLLIVFFILGVLFATSCSNNSQSIDSVASDNGHPEELMAVQGNITQEWINLEGFQPNSSVTINIFEFEGGTSKTEPFSVQISEDGHGSIDGFQFELNLKPGMHIKVTDDSKKVVRELTLEDITLDIFNTNLDIVEGTAPPNADLWVTVHDEVLNEGHGIEVTADSDGKWLADFYEIMEVNLNENMNPQVLMYDGDNDATVAELTRQPYIEGNLPLDWIAAIFFSPDSSVTIEIYKEENGPLIGEPFIVDTNWNGEATFEGSDFGVDLQPGMYLVIRDNSKNEVLKDLILVDILIEKPNFDTNEVSGYGPPDTRLTFELYVHNGGGEYYADVLSDGDGYWYLDFFEEFGESIPDTDSTHIKLFDEDGDASVADPF